MATFKPGPTIDDIRGRLGGSVCSRNLAGHTIRAWDYPGYKRTAGQDEKRGWLQNVRNDWGQLTQEQIDAWNALAATPPEVDYNRVGDVMLLSGSAWHMRINMRRLQAGQAIESDAPAGVAVDVPLTFGLTVYESSNEVDDSVMTYTQDDFDGFYAVLQVSLVSSLVQQVMYTGYKSVWCGTVTDSTSQIITDELYAACGIRQLGQRCFGRLWKQSTDGIRSGFISTFSNVLEAT
jgi:hypothetical protein